MIKVLIVIIITLEAIVKKRKLIYTVLDSLQQADYLNWELKVGRRKEKIIGYCTHSRRVR